MLLGFLFPLFLPRATDFAPLLPFFSIEICGFIFPRLFCFHFFKGRWNDGGSLYLCFCTFLLCETSLFRPFFPFSIFFLPFFVCFLFWVQTSNQCKLPPPPLPMTKPILIHINSMNPIFLILDLVPSTNFLHKKQ